MKKALAYAVAVMMVIACMPGAAFAQSTPAEKGVRLQAPGQLKGKAAGKEKIRLTWAKTAGAKGYEVYCAEGKQYKKTAVTKKASFLSKTLKKDKTYKFKVRAYKTVKGKTVKSGFCSPVKVRTGGDQAKAKIRNVQKIGLSSKSLLVKKGEKVSLKAALSPNKNLVSKTVKWTSGDKKTADVSAKGVVTGRETGTCTITATAHNGLQASCKVTVISALSMSEDVYRMTKELAAAEDYAFDVGYTLAYDEAYADDKTGFRTAGSDAEHAASKYLAKEFKKIGLTDVERVPVTVDKWQFNEAYMQLNYQDNGKKKTLRIDDMVSYASDGTVQLDRMLGSKAPDWSKLEIIDVGMGFKSDYDAIKAAGGSAEGKIVLAGVDQWNEVWIDGPYMEAAEQKATAIVTYPVGGYGQKNEDAINVQDLCAPNEHIPCTSISKNDAERIQAAIKAGGTSLTAKLYVDNYVGDEDGISYNVTGKIKGKDSNGQQIVFAAHYDKYFYGFQDDCIAMGLVAAIAKAMVKSGYQPEHDIVFVAHGAEEWGEFETSTDWAIGSWEMITEARSDWRGRTLALFNYELPAIDHGAKNGIMRTSREMGHIGRTFLASDLLDNVEAFYPNGIKLVNDDEMVQTDVIAYQFSGVPAAMPRQDNRTQWTQEHYHTQFDDVDTYSAELLEYDIACYGALAMYVDKTPALELDFRDRCSQLEEVMDAGTKKIAGNDSTIAAYQAALAELKTASEGHFKKVQAVNQAYEAAVKEGASASQLEKYRKEGKALNAETLKLFQFAQDAFVGLATYEDTEIFHKGTQNNIELLDEVLAALKDGTVTEDDTYIPQALYGWYEYYAYLFSDAVCEKSNKVLMNENVEDNWATGKLSRSLPSYKTTKEMCRLFAEGKIDTKDYEEVIQAYEADRAELLKDFRAQLNQEIEGMKTMAQMMQ